MANRYVNTDLSPGGDGLTPATAWATLYEGIIPWHLTTLSQPYDIFCSGVAPDTGDYDHDPWEFYTTPTNRVRIFGNNALGKWNLNAYKIHALNQSGIYNQYAAHLELYNLQVQVKHTSGGPYNGVRLSTANNDVTGGPGYLVYKNVIVRRDPSTSTGQIRLFYDSILGPGAGSGELRRINCLCIGSGSAGVDQGYGTDDDAWARAHSKTYNSTAAKTQVGFASNAISVNCLATSNLVGFTADAPGTDYCVEDDGNGVGGGGTHNHYASTPILFVDAANGDYNLQQADTEARGRALVNPASSLYLDDIRGRSRGLVSWDVGAHQWVATPTGLLVPFSGMSGMSGRTGGGRS